MFSMTEFRAASAGLPGSAGHCVNTLCHSLGSHLNIDSSHLSRVLTEINWNCSVISPEMRMFVHVDETTDEGKIQRGEVWPTYSLRICAGFVESSVARKHVHSGGDIGRGTQFYTYWCSVASMRHIYISNQSLKCKWQLRTGVKRRNCSDFNLKVLSFKGIDVFLIAKQMEEVCKLNVSCVVCHRCKVSHKVDCAWSGSLRKIHHQIGRVVVRHPADRAGYQGQSALSRWGCWCASYVRS